MPLRSGKQYLNLVLPVDEQPFKLVLLPKKTYDSPQEVKIDFDEASRQWRKNKHHLGEGMFMYKRYSERLFS
jgi:hypothetical protein